MLLTILLIATLAAAYLDVPDGTFLALCAATLTGCIYDVVSSYKQIKEANNL